MGTPSRSGNASRSARQTSTSAARWNLSGPLQIGHARMSSSLSSIFSLPGPLFSSTAVLEVAGPRQHEIRQLTRIALGKFRGDGHVPAALVGEGDAFYGILLRHDDWKVVAKVQIAGFERVMIGHRMFVQRQAGVAKHVEETLRIADGRHRVNTRAAETRERTQ